MEWDLGGVQVHGLLLLPRHVPAGIPRPSLHLGRRHPRPGIHPHSLSFQCPPMDQYEWEQESACLSTGLWREPGAGGGGSADVDLSQLPKRVLRSRGLPMVCVSNRRRKAECSLVWRTIDAPAGHQVAISFDDFYTSSNEDFVYIYDGGAKSNLIQMLGTRVFRRRSTGTWPVP